MRLYSHCEERCERQAAEERRFPIEGIEAMMDAGLFNLALVKAVGGDEGHPVLQMEVYEAIATIFPKKHRTVVAGQAAPLGKARSSDGG